MRINGTGTTLLGISPMDSSGVATATRWITFLYLPVVPLARYRVHFLPNKGRGFSYQELERLGLNGREILTTYLFFWLVIPLVLLAPFVLAIAEVWQKLSLPPSGQIPYMIATIIWFGVWVWKLADWHEARGHPPAHE